MSLNVRTAQNIQSGNSQSKKEGKDQESIQSSTTPDPGYQCESGNFTIRNHKREPRGQQDTKPKIHETLFLNFGLVFKKRPQS